MPIIIDLGRGGVPITGGGQRQPTYLDSIMRGFGVGLDIQQRAATREREDAWRETLRRDEEARFQQQQANADRSFGLQTEQFDFARQQAEASRARADRGDAFEREKWQYGIDQQAAARAREADQADAMSQALLMRPNYRTGMLEPNDAMGPPTDDPMSAELPPEVMRRLSPDQQVAVVRMMSEDQRRVMAMEQQRREMEAFDQAQQQQRAMSSLATQQARDAGIVGPEVGPGAPGQLSPPVFQSLPAPVQQSLLQSAGQSQKVRAAVEAIERSNLSPQEKQAALLKIEAVSAGFPASVIPDASSGSGADGPGGGKPVFTVPQIAGGDPAKVRKEIAKLARQNVLAKGVPGGGNVSDPGNTMLSYFRGDSAEFKAALAAEEARLLQLSGLGEAVRPAPGPGAAVPAASGATVPAASADQVRGWIREAKARGITDPAAIRQYVEAKMARGGS